MPKHNFHSDPALFRVERPAGGDKLILALDLGTVTGYALHYWRPGTAATILPQHLGQFNLSAGSYDSGAIRFVRLRHFLNAICPDAVFFEDVRYTPAESLTRFNAHAAVARAATAAELFGAFKATVATWCEERNIPCGGFSIQHIKKRATGKGNANKEAVILACNQAFGTNFEVESYESTGVDNIADAAWCCLLAVEQYADGVAAAPTTGSTADLLRQVLSLFRQLPQAQRADFFSGFGEFCRHCGGPAPCQCFRNE